MEKYSALGQRGRVASLITDLESRLNGLVVPIKEGYYQIQDPSEAELACELIEKCNASDPSASIVYDLPPDELERLQERGAARMLVYNRGIARRRPEDVFDSQLATTFSYVCPRRMTTYEWRVSKETSSGAGSLVMLFGPSATGKTACWTRSIDSVCAYATCNRVAIAKVYEEILRGLGAYGERISSIDFETNHTRIGKTSVHIPEVALEWSLQAGTRRSFEQTFKKPLPNPSPQSLAKILKGLGINVLVLDDFHKLTDPGSVIADDLKVFITEGVSVVLAGIPKDPLAIVDSETSTRFHPLRFDYWRPEDIRKIAVKGATALDATFTEETLQMLTTEAAGSPLLMQDFCHYAALSCKNSDMIALSESQFRDFLRRADSRVAMVGAKLFASIREAAAGTPGLRDGLVDTIVDELKREPRMEIALDLLDLDDADERMLDSFAVKLCEQGKLCEDLIVFRQGAMWIGNPLLVVYVRTFIS